jgi:hypothetical protein
MKGKPWKKVADEQFNSLPKDIQDDWADLRERVYQS